MSRSHVDHNSMPCDMPVAHADAPLGDVLVLGLGKTGVVVARYLLDRLGSRVSSVTVYGGASSREGDASRSLEAAGARVVLGTEEVEGSYDLAIASPGISEFSPFFQAARACSSEVIGEPEFAYRESPSLWIAITGTNGKTTTTTLTTELLRAAGLSASSVGNIGTVATGELDERQDGDWFVAELSSFQLATSSRLHPRVAVLLNVTPDHVAWHKSLENYALAKERVFQNLDGGDFAVVSDEDSWCRDAISRLEARGLRVCRVNVHADPGSPSAAFVRDGRCMVRIDGEEHALILADNLPIRGEHNLQNALAAASVALELGISDAAVCHALLAFHALEHRIEPCGELSGVHFVNDSKATNTDAVEKALTAFVPGRVVLMLGGHDKGTELASLAHAANARCRAVVCYGEAGERIASSIEAADDLGTRVVRATHMEDALDAAIAAAEPGDTVLLSPACSSFDEFSGFEQRGRVFKQLVASRIAGQEKAL